MGNPGNGVPAEVLVIHATSDLMQRTSTRQTISTQQTLKQRFEDGDPEVGLLGQPSGKYDYYVLYNKLVFPQPCKIIATGWGDLEEEKLEDPMMILRQYGTGLALGNPAYVPEESSQQHICASSPSRMDQGLALGDPKDMPGGHRRRRNSRSRRRNKKLGKSLGSPENASAEMLVIHGSSEADHVTNTRRGKERRKVEQAQKEHKVSFTAEILPDNGEGITFTQADMEGVKQPHGDALVVRLQIGDTVVHRVLIDGGSSVDILFAHCYDRLQIPPNALQPSGTTLTGFSGEKSMVEGEVNLLTKAGETVQPTRFIVVRADSPYNAILGRTWLHAIKAVASTLHQCLKFRSPKGIVRIRGDQCMSITTAMQAEGRGVSTSPHAPAK